MATIRQQLTEQAEQIAELRKEVAELKAHLIAYRVIEFGHYPQGPRAVVRHLHPVRDDAG